MAAELREHVEHGDMRDDSDSAPQLQGELGLRDRCGLAQKYQCGAETRTGGALKCKIQQKSFVAGKPPLKEVMDGAERKEACKGSIDERVSVQEDSVGSRPG